MAPRNRRHSAVSLSNTIEKAENGFLCFKSVFPFFLQYYSVKILRGRWRKTSEATKDSH